MSRDTPRRRRAGTGQTRQLPSKPVDDPTRVRPRTAFPGPDDEDRIEELDTGMVARVLGSLPGYEVVEKLGQGAMGAVYLARHVPMDRPVAIKVLLPYYAQDTDAVERFQREMRNLARCSHPNIVAGYDAGVVEGVYYYVMEYVEGLPLDEVLEIEGCLPFERALGLVRDIASALEHAHPLGLVHRDVKPSNLLVDLSGTAKLADLGLAKIVGDTSGASPVTQAGWVVGTPPYMPPEQLGAATELDTRTDIYALGITFFELLTGDVPYPTRGIEHLSDDKLAGRLPEHLLRKAGVGDEAIAVIRRMCAPARDDRYADPTALLADLDRLARGEPVDTATVADAADDRRVLLVEDDLTTALMVSTLLEKEGYRVEVLHDGREAVGAIETKRPAAIVLLDVELPGADGFEILSRLRASPTWSAVPVVMLTGRKAEGDIVRALDAGANDHVAKPPRPAELLARVRRHMVAS